MKPIARVGLDIAKSVFQLHAVDVHGKPVFRKTLSRGEMLSFFAKLTPCLIGIEACAGSHYWARELIKFGHDARLMAAQFVSPYRKGGKNDANDAEAICEAVGRPNMRFVPVKSVGQPYEVRLVSFRAMKEPTHQALHPFGQIPTYEEGDLVLFETGAIVFHIAERHAGLLPDDANARARAITWMFAALSTVEPPILELGNAKLLEGDKPWCKERLPMVEDRVRARLNPLSRRLGDADSLDGAFSAGDLMMVSVLLRLKSSGILDEYPNLAAYVARGEARPAYKRAFAAQLAINTGKPPAG